VRLSGLIGAQPIPGDLASITAPALAWHAGEAALIAALCYPREKLTEVLDANHFDHSWNGRWAHGQ
jgi:hypothetical protein